MVDICVSQNKMLYLPSIYFIILLMIDIKYTK